MTNQANRAPPGPVRLKSCASPWCSQSAYEANTAARVRPHRAVSGSVDLRTLDRHPGASISSLISSISCPAMLTESAVRPARNLDGGAAVIVDSDAFYMSKWC